MGRSRARGRAEGRLSSALLFQVLGALSQQLGKGLAGDGLAEEEPLHFVAGEPLKEILLFLRFYTLGYDGEVETLAHGDDRFRYRFVLEIVRQIADEGAVDLQ